MLTVIKVDKVQYRAIHPIDEEIERRVKIEEEKKQWEYEKLKSEKKKKKKEEKCSCCIVM